MLVVPDHYATVPGGCPAYGPKAEELSHWFRTEIQFPVIRTADWQRPLLADEV